MVGGGRRMPWLAFPTTLPSGSDKAPNLVSSGRGCDICQSSTVTTATCGLAWTWEPDAHIIHVERPRPSGQETRALHEIRGSSGRRQLAVLGRDGLGRGSCGLFSRPARVTVSRANGHPATRRPQARGRRLVVSHKPRQGSRVGCWVAEPPASHCTTLTRQCRYTTKPPVTGPVDDIVMFVVARGSKARIS